MTNDGGTRHYTTYVHAPAKAVWDLLSSGDAQGDWYLPAAAWQLQDGGELAWGPGGQTVVSGRGVAHRPDAFFLAHTFAFGFLGEPAGEVRWRITPMGDVTQVWLRHELGDRPATEGIVGGSWPVMLARLKTLAERGTPMPEPVWPTDEGWDADPV